MYYILNEDHSYRSASRREWAKFMEILDKDPLHRHVARTLFYVDDAEYCNLSTVFLGLDHGIGGQSPVLFESMIFGGAELDESTERYSSWDEAEVGHSKLWHKINIVILDKFEVASQTQTREGKLTNVHFSLRVKSFVPLNEYDLRLIREN
jgi:hypothetical protein